MKFRDKVGVPSNLRAVQDKPRNLANSYWDIDARKALIMRYIREHQGKQIPLKRLSAVAGYNSDVGAHNPVKQLMKEGKIQKRKLKSGYTFDIPELHVASNLDKGDPRNGEVVITKEPKIQSEVEAYKALAEKIVLEETKTPRIAKSGELVFAEQLDLLIWEFLKQLDVSKAQYQNTALGETTQALREFSAYVAHKAIKETENEQEKENV